MAELVVENLGPLKAVLQGDRWWDAILRHAPRAMQPLATAIRQGAPRPHARRRPGTPRLGARMDVVADVQVRGFERGVRVAIISRQPYGHLVAEGHRIVPRGPTRRVGLTRAERKSLRSGLKARRAAGAFGVFGRVPGNPWVTNATARERPRVLALLEQLVRQDLRLGQTA